MGSCSLYKKLICSTNPKINPDDEIQELSQVDRQYELLLYNDDVSLF